MEPFSWGAASSFGLGLADSFSSGNDLAAADAPTSFNFDPFSPIDVYVEGFSIPAEKSGLLDFSLGKSIDPGSFSGSIITGIVTGGALLILASMVRKK